MICCSVYLQCAVQHLPDGLLQCLRLVSAAALCAPCFLASFNSHRVNISQGTGGVNVHNAEMSMYWLSTSASSCSKYMQQHLFIIVSSGAVAWTLLSHVHCCPKLQCLPKSYLKLSQSLHYDHQMHCSGIQSVAVKVLYMWSCLTRRNLFDLDVVLNCLSTFV
jgi:hypothetical protein